MSLYAKLIFSNMNIVSLSRAPGWTRMTPGWPKMTQDDPKVTKDDPRVTQDDPSVTQDYPRAGFLIKRIWGRIFPSEINLTVADWWISTVISIRKASFVVTWVTFNNIGEIQTLINNYDGWFFSDFSGLYSPNVWGSTEDISGFQVETMLTKVRVLVKLCSRNSLLLQIKVQQFRHLIFISE